jgi:hypothetical protein
MDATEGYFFECLRIGCTVLSSFLESDCRNLDKDLFGIYLALILLSEECQDDGWMQCLLDSDLELQFDNFDLAGSLGVA